MNACASHAISKIDGAMIVDDSACIGCKNCLMACPFGAVELLPLYSDGKPVAQIGTYEGRITAVKCDRCYKLEIPACVAVCPHEALRIADIEAETKDKKLKAAIALAMTRL